MSELSRRGPDPDLWEETDSISEAAGFSLERWLDRVSGELGRGALVATLTWPADTRQRRVYAHLFGPRGEAVGFATIALGSPSGRQVIDETGVVERLRARALRRCRVPAVLARGELDGHRYAVFELPPEGARSVGRDEWGALADAAAEFAGPVREVAGAEVRGLSWWSAYELRRTPAMDAFDHALRDATAFGVRVRFQHGDLGPHCVALVGQERWVFGWEHAADDAPCAADEVSFWLHTRRDDLARAVGPEGAVLFRDAMVDRALPERRADVLLAIAFGVARGSSAAAAVALSWGATARALAARTPAQGDVFVAPGGTEDDAGGGMGPAAEPVPGAAPARREAHRAIIRIVTNYARLGLNLALGLAFVPFMLRWVGDDAMGLIILLGAGVGFAAIFREITVRSVVRELGAAFHTRDDAHFRAIFNSALVVSTGMACVAALLFTALYFCLPLLTIPDAFDRAARVMVVSQGIYVLVTTALSPIFNMLVVTERFVRYNMWILAERCTMLASAVALWAIFGRSDPGTDVSRWSMLVAALQCATFLVPVGLLMLGDERLRPALSRVSRAGVRTISKTLSLYIAVEVASALYEKVGQLIVNLFFGLVGNTIFGIAYQFVSYVRQATVGVTFGLDAVSARLSTGGQRPLQALMHHSTRLHGLAAIPTGAAVFLLAEPLIRTWVGTRLEEPEKYIPGIVLTVRIMSISLTARAIAEGWTAILYGAGFLKRYAPLVLTGGIIFPPLAISLLKVLGAPGNPSLTLFVVPATFCALQFMIYCVILPWIAARCIAVRYREMFLPLWRPLFITVTAGAVLVFALPAIARDPTRPGVVALGGAGVMFGIVYALLAFGLVLDREERERFVWGPLRRLRARGRPRT